MCQSGGPWSRRSSSNDTLTSSDTLTHFLNNSTISSNRSSNGSIPFTGEEELIRQNYQDWLHLERIFYGEEPLPADERTREEFTDWMETFPHLRLVGKPINTERFRVNRNPIYHEEILAMDPPPEDNRRFRRDRDRDGDRERSMASKSGHITSRNPFTSRDSHLDQLMVVTARPGGLASTSANLLRLPAISNPQSSSSWATTRINQHSISTDREKRLLTGRRAVPLTSAITLPLINIDKVPVTFGDLLTTRRIPTSHSQPLGHSGKEYLRDRPR